MGTCIYWNEVLKQCLQTLPSPPPSLLDPAHGIATFSFVHTDGEPGTGYQLYTMGFEINRVNLGQGNQKLVRNSGEFKRAEMEIADSE